MKASPPQSHLSSLNHSSFFLLYISVGSLFYSGPHSLRILEDAGECLCDGVKDGKAVPEVQQQGLHHQTDDQHRDGGVGYPLVGLSVIEAGGKEKTQQGVHC